MNNMKNITLFTLGELLTHPNPTIRRLAGSILKLLQRQDPPKTELQRRLDSNDGINSYTKSF